MHCGARAVETDRKLETMRGHADNFFNRTRVTNRPPSPETEAAGSSTVDSKYLYLQQWRRWKTTDFFHFCEFSPNTSAPCCLDIQRNKDHLQKHEVVCGCNCDI